MSDLTEFLLARIREDEEFAPICDSVRSTAECKAKRRIVEAFKFEDSDESAVDEWMAQEPSIRPPAAIQSLIFVAKCLALPYADHPDYRQEWKP